MAASFKTAMGARRFNGPVTVDCANGVGGPKLVELIRYLPSPSEGGLEIKVVNDDVLRPENLNYQVSYRFSTSWQRKLSQMPPVWSRLCQNKSASTALVPFSPARKVLFT